jgi:predicted neuraminidase
MCNAGGMTMISIVESKKEFVFKDDRDFDTCHASALVRLANGDILAAWFGGSGEGNADVAIWMARRTTTGWQRPFVVADRWGSPLWNPSLFRRSDGRILLFYKDAPTISQWKTMLKYSDDDGKTFSEARQLVNEIPLDRGPVKNKCILLSNGSIAAPGSSEPEGVEIWDSFVDISSDGGETWERGAFIPVRRADSRARDFAPDLRRCYGKGLIQPALWESLPGHIHALMRSTSASIFRSDSVDGGKTWSCAYNTGLPNNNSGIDLVKLDTGELLLVSNPVGKDWGPRTPLTLSCSDDNGTTWQEIFVFENENGEYSYPAVIAQGNEVFLTYTWRRERIAYWHLKVSG